MKFTLSQLGPYRIERTEDYPECPDGDKSYCEIIRVRGSKARTPAFMIPSHLYKYSETELCLYMKDKKNLWNALGKLLKEDIDISDNEVVLRFPVSKFKEIAIIVPFIRKKTRKTPLSELEMERASHLREHRKDIMKQIEQKSTETDTGKAITLEIYGETEK